MIDDASNVYLSNVKKTFEDINNQLCFLIELIAKFQD